MTWMLLSVEVSAVLLAVASLGFLGYYVGGVVWIMVSDFAASRATGMPELGEMLANSASVLSTQPWSMLVVGAAVFLVVSGIQLARRRLAAAAGARSAAPQLGIQPRHEPGGGEDRSGRSGAAVCALGPPGVPVAFSRRRLRRVAIAAGVFAWQAQANRPALQCHGGARRSCLGCRAARSARHSRDRRVRSDSAGHPMGLS